MGKKLTLGFLALAGTIGLSAGCGGETIYVNGTVVNEFGSIVDRQKAIQSSSGALFGNESIKIGSTYGVQFKAEDGKVYTMGIVSSSSMLETLNMAIEKGTKFRIEKHDFDLRFEGPVGCVYSSEIEILPNE